MKKLLLIVCFCMPFLSSCAIIPEIVSPIVTGIVTWENGVAHKYYNEEAHTMYRATKISLKDLGYSIIDDKSHKSNGYYILAGDSDKFKITIRQVKPHITEVKIRINFMGDKPYAQLLYHEIDSNTNTIDFDDQGQPTKLKTRRRVNQ